MIQIKQNDMEKYQGEFKTEEEAREAANFQLSDGDIDAIHIVQYMDESYGLVDDADYDEDDENNDFDVVETIYYVS